MSIQKYVTYLMETLQATAINAGYPQSIDNQQALIDYNVYFDICQLIFPELCIDLIKIREENNFKDGEKMQYLIQLLSEVLNVDFSSIQGQEIVNSNIDDILALVQVLHQYSIIFAETKKKVGVAKSQIDRKNIQKIEDQVVKPQVRGRHSSHQPNRSKQNFDKQQKIVPKQGKPVAKNHDQQYLIPQQKKQNKRPTYSSKSRQAKNNQIVRKNIHEDVVKIILQQKGRWMKASKRENRKNKLGDIELFKNGYRIYLQRYSKENRANQNRNEILNQISQNSKSQNKDRAQKKDLENIDKNFKSFAYRLRDAKAVYLRKMRELIRRQEMDRNCYKNRIQRENKQQIEDQLRKDIEKEIHQKRVKVQLLKQTQNNLIKSVNQSKKQQRLRVIQQKRQLRESKKKQLQKIQNLLKEDNEKVLMCLQAGGNLQKTIMQMYKYF